MIRDPEKPTAERRGRHHNRRPPPFARLIGAAASIAVAVAAMSLAYSGGARPAVNALGLAPVPGAERASPFPSPSSSPTTDSVAPRWGAFAQARGIRLYLPAPEPVAVTYHEASFGNALALHPIGHVVRNANRWKFEPPPRADGPGYIVMSSRGRGTPATSAADVVLPPFTPVRSPVTGRVVEIREYHLYCRYPDYVVKIHPSGETNLSVVMIHLHRLAVHRGEPVFATLSVIGYPRVFPFRSQVDDYVRGGNPHVHIEIAKPHKARPTC